MTTARSRSLLDRAWRAIQWSPVAYLVDRFVLAVRPLELDFNDENHSDAKAKPDRKPSHRWSLLWRWPATTLTAERAARGYAWRRGDLVAYWYDVLS